MQTSRHLQNLFWELVDAICKFATSKNMNITPLRGWLALFLEKFEERSVEQFSITIGELTITMEAKWKGLTKNTLHQLMVLVSITKGDPDTNGQLTTELATRFDTLVYNYLTHR